MGCVSCRMAISWDLPAAVFISAGGGADQQGIRPEVIGAEGLRLTGFASSTIDQATASRPGTPAELPEGADAMKVLILSWYFPPSNTIGAIRVGKLAKYLMRRNVDVRVGARARPYLSKPALEIPGDRVTWTRAVDVDRSIDIVGNLRNRLLRRAPKPGGGAAPEHRGVANGGRGSLVGRVLSTVSDYYLNLSNLPDRYVGWLPWAIAGAERLPRLETGPDFRHRPALHRLLPAITSAASWACPGSRNSATAGPTILSSRRRTGAWLCSTGWSAGSPAAPAASSPCRNPGARSTGPSAASRSRRSTTATTRRTFRSSRTRRPLRRHRPHLRRTSPLPLPESSIPAAATLPRCSRR